MLDKKGERKETDSKKLGSVAHTLILEPEKFHTEYAVFPHEKLNFTFKKNKLLLEDFTKDHPGLKVIMQDDYKKALVIKESVYSHKDARVLLEESGEAEVSGYAIIEHIMPDGEMVPFKVRWRPDRKNISGAMIDIKTAKSVERDSFEKDSFGYFSELPDNTLKLSRYSWHYDLSAVLYMKGHQALTGVLPPWHWLVIKNDHPFETAVYRCSERRFQEGEKKLRHALNTIIMAERSGKWEFQSHMEEI